MQTSTTTVVVTGATGILGSRVVQQLVLQGYHVHAVTHTPLPPQHPLRHERVSFAVLDCTRLSEEELLAWLAPLRPLALIHCVALTDLTACERQPVLSYHINTHVTQLLARVCAHYRTHFLLLSTEYVFDGTRPSYELYSEQDPVHPLNCYGMTKLQGEFAVQEECSDRTAWTVCRAAVVYGSAPWSRPDFLQWLRMKLRQREPVRIASDQISSPTYAFDLARMLVALVERRVTGIYHTAGSTPIDRYHFALKIAREYALDDSLIQPATTADLGLDFPRPLNVGLSVNKISTLLATPPLSLADGLTSFRRQETEAFAPYQQPE